MSQTQPQNGLYCAHETVLYALQLCEGVFSYILCPSGCHPFVLVMGSLVFSSSSPSWSFPVSIVVVVIVVVYIIIIILSLIGAVHEQAESVWNYLARNMVRISNFSFHVARYYSHHL